MAKKRRTKKKRDENQSYEIEVADWETNYYFGLNPGIKDFIEGAYWEHSRLVLTGKILSPTPEKANNARIEIADEPQMDDHWTQKPTIISAKAIGWMEIPRGDDTLIIYCSIPSRLFRNILLAVDAEKIKFASLLGTKLKWRRGTISSIRLSKYREEE